MTRPRLYKTEGIVLKQFSIGEADQIVTLLTNNYGKLRPIAKGVRRVKSRLAGHLEPLTLCRLMLARGRNMDVVSDAEGMASFPNLRTNLESLTRGLICTELVDVFLPEELPSPPIFHLLLDCLNWLDQGETDRAVHYFELHLLRHLGFMPELYQCVLCGTTIKPGEHGFSLEFGGIVCTHCYRTNDGSAGPSSTPYSVSTLSLNALKVLRHFRMAPFSDIQQMQFPDALSLELDHLLRRYLTYLSERRLHAPEFLDKIRK